MICRDFDGYYFGVERNGKWCNVCFTDLTDYEATNIIKDKSDEWLESLYAGLSEVMYEIFFSLTVGEFQRAYIRHIYETDTPYTKVMKARHNIIAMHESRNYYRGLNYEY